MNTTHLTLLQRAGSGASEAWAELDGLYRPFVRSWFRSQAVEQADADDLTQEVLTALFKELPQFEHSGRTGAFRCWLRNMCRNRLLGHRRAKGTRNSHIRGDDFHDHVQAVAEDDPLIADWDREHDLAILRYLFVLVESQFEPETLLIFRRLTLEGRTAAEVATEFRTTAGAVYVMRSRVLRRMREEGERLLGEEIPEPPETLTKLNTDS